MLTLPAAADTASLADLGIDQLMATEVTSVARKEQKLAETAAAIYVLTADDIRRSSATSLPELLLSVPGVEGGAINNHIHGIGIRGLNGQWSNKLLVLIDGRSIYTRTFSGVYWDSHNLPLEDIERIEVIRGAGAAQWGANAVNGVINIITRHSGDTPGTLARISAGTESTADVLVRHGGALGEHGTGRIFFSSQQQGAAAGYRGGKADDDWRTHRVGGRADWAFSRGFQVMAQAEHFTIDSDNDLPYGASSYSSLPSGLPDMRSDVRGHSLHLAVTHAYGLTAEWTAQLSWSKVRREEFLGIEERVVDADFQHRFQPFDGHDVVWGVNARYREDETDPLQIVRFDPVATEDTNASIFFQDEVALLGDRLRLTLANRFEYDEHNGWETQPSLRALWNGNDRHKVWAAMSRAARTPSRFDRDLNVLLPLPPTPMLPELAGLPIVLAVRGSKDFKTETMLSYELGYRLQPAAGVALDLALFHSRYRDLSNIDLAQVSFVDDFLLLELPLANERRGEIWGGELVATWIPDPSWRVEGFWAEQRLSFAEPSTIDIPVAAFSAGSSPERQLGLRVDWTIDDRWSAGLHLKYVAELTAHFNYALQQGRIPSYVDADLVVHWRALPNVTVSLFGKNLLDRSRLEFASEGPLTPVEMRRSALLRASWAF